MSGAISAQSEQSALQMGHALARAGNARGACSYFQSALAINPSNISALQGLAAARLSINQVAESRDAADQLVRLAPNSPRTWEAMARAYLAMRSYPLAAHAADEVIRLAPNQAYGFHILAAARIGQGRYREALKAATEALRLAPGSAVMHAQVGLARLELRGPGAARPDIETAYRLSPTDAYVGYAAAMLAIASGQRRRTRELCEAILRKDVNHRAVLELYVLSDGPFPLHRLATRWRYLCASAGKLAIVLRVLGVLVYMVVIVMLTAGTWGSALILGIALRAWAKSEQRRRQARVRKFFEAPSIAN